MSVVYLALAIAMMTATLVARDQTEYRLSRLRSELISLRAEEKRLNEERQDLDRIVAQIVDALERAKARQVAAEEGSQRIIQALAAMGVQVDVSSDAQTPVPPPTPPPEVEEAAPPA